VGAVAALAVSALGTVLVANQAAAASSTPPAPLKVQATTLVQDGPQLVWNLRLSGPFAPEALAPNHRTLCLLIERPESGIVESQVCLAGPPRHSRTPRLLYGRITSHGSGVLHAIAATITRASPAELTASFLPDAIDRSYVPLRWQVISTLRSAACAPTAPGGGCFELYPPSPTLLALHTPVLTGCVPSGRSLVYSGSTHTREIALTFDDGPWNDPPSARFLDVLEREHVPATFFEIGRQIAGFDPRGAVERRMLADGDMIGDHSWSHPMVATLPASQQRRQLLETAAAIRHATGGFTPCLWRPPYGDISPSLVALARSLGFLTIMWNVDPRDWALPGVGAIYSNVVTNSRNGAIVLQHFGGGPRFQTLAALPLEIANLRRRGYQFVTVTQLLGLRLVYR
jgi:peptidoglycan-N-acetylglucosamine deacetylase